ncbi:receptor-type tyrosine- phosphatase U-like protein [Labeo rohita]|nr:receptor-type tyrosine- phosphatase U-like protein [Labeo rohita]RXN21993.1 receptor-type tyrosine- phosphatase U-like protein [Labeo rohita]
MRVTVGGMVRENNLIRLREIRDKVIADNVNFESIDVSLATIDRVLRRQKMWMKQVYRVPFERNSARHKDLHYEYVQRILQLDAIARPHEYLFLDEAGFNLQK